MDLPKTAFTQVGEPRKSVPARKPTNRPDVVIPPTRDLLTTDPTIRYLPWANSLVESGATVDSFRELHWTQQTALAPMLTRIWLYSGTTIDLEIGVVRHANGDVIQLSGAEAICLQELVKAGGNFLGTERLARLPGLRHVGGVVRRLRVKIVDDGRCVVSHRGFGYRLVVKKVEKRSDFW